MSVTKNIMSLIGDGNEEQVEILRDLTKARLRLKLGLAEDVTIPDKLNYIVIRATVAMYNRIGSEGVSSHSVSEESLHFIDDELAAFDKDIEEYLASMIPRRRGVVRFI